MKYDIDYFIKKIEAIPEEQWITLGWDDKQECKCVLGHLGEDPSKQDENQNILSTEESAAYKNLLWKGADGWEINDSILFAVKHYLPDFPVDKLDFFKPKHNVLTHLYWLKEKNNV